MEAVICFSHLRWNFVFQRPQHLMVRFAKTHRVFFMEEARPVADDMRPHLEYTTDRASGVCIVTPRCLMDGSDLDAQIKMLLDTLLREEKIANPVLWYYTPMMRRLSAHIVAGCVVYDCMDELANFKFAPADMSLREQELFTDADIVFTGGESLYERKLPLHPNVHLFPSSVDEHHFRKAREQRVFLSDNDAPLFGYHGVIDERMDLELLAAIADARPSWRFALIGPIVKIDAATLPARANIEYLGAKAYDSLPQYLAAWDVAMMPFAMNEATQYISPTKTPEYFAAGLPVVSTPIRDVVRRYGVLKAICIGATAAEFIMACERALELRAQDDAWLKEIDAVLAVDSWDRTFSGMRSAIAGVKRTVRAVSPFVRATVRRAHYDYLIVGAGFAGSVMAERLARGSDRRVLVIDKRNHIGGNAYDEYDAAGILVHRYGPHIFHTNSDRVLAYLSRFTEWRPYEHRVLASTGGLLLPIPINRTTLNTLYGLGLQTEAQAAAFLESRALPIANVQTAADMILSTVGRELYETFFRCYTMKQWGVDPSELDKAVTARVPARTNTDDRYFTDKHQCMPLHGYTTMFENILDHKNITVMTGVDFASVKEEDIASRTIFTGPVDEYFDLEFGPLQYRSLRFRRETLNQRRFQPVGVVNYPSADVDFTRITEYTHLTGQISNRTSLSYEYPSDSGEPYYPVPSAVNQALYQQYEQRAAETPRTTFLGRLGTYRYYNMDQVVGQALSTYHRLEGDASNSSVHDRFTRRAYA